MKIVIDGGTSGKNDRKISYDNGTPPRKHVNHNMMTMWTMETTTK
jgi:hypothetical protein